MKKIIIIMIITMLMLMAGCINKRSDSENMSTPQPTAAPDVLPTVTPSVQPTMTPTPVEWALTIEDYFPLLGDTEHIYEGEGNEYASFKRYVDYLDIENKKLQSRTNNGGTETVRVIQIKDGKLSVIYQENECYYRANFMSEVATHDAEILLMEPLTEGTQWQLSDGRRRYISGVKVPVTTPYGSFDALEVTSESEESTTKDYYAVGIGLIKSLYQSEGLEVSSMLSAVKQGKALTQQFLLFYAAEDEMLYTEQTEISLSTGSDMAKAMEKAMKRKPSESSRLPLMSDNTKINSLKVEEGNIVHVDLSGEFITQMNAGAGYELLILQGVTNTLGNYYGVSKVLITIDGKPYESGHIRMEEGEAFEFNTDKVAQ